MAVVMLVALLFTAGALSVRNITGATLKRDAYVLASNIGAIHTRAITKNAYFRMVFNLDEHTYTTELADTRFFIGQGKEEDDKPLWLPKDKKATQAGQVQFVEDAEGPAMHYAAASEVKDALLKKMEFKRGIKLAGVMTTHQKDVRESGKAYLYFFPNGFMEKAVIFVTDGTRTFSLETQPLTGRVRVYNERIRVPSDFDREEEYGGHF